MASNELSIQIQSARDDTTLTLTTTNSSNVAVSPTIDVAVSPPLSPASVKNYKTNRARVTISDSDDNAHSHDENGDDSNDNDEEDEEDAGYGAAHLDPMLEALDGTTKYQEKKEVEAAAAADEEEGGTEGGEDSDTSPLPGDEEPLDRDEQIAKEMEGLSVEGAQNEEEEKEDTTHLARSGGGAACMPTIREESPLGRPSSTATSSVTGSDSGVMASGVEEMTMEPARPDINFPCLIETATNPPRTRITLPFPGQPQQPLSGRAETGAEIGVAAPTEGAGMAPTSTRGRRVHMVATDLSGESWYATEWAITTMLRNGDELNVVTIVEDEKDAKGVHRGLQTEMREDAEKLTKNIRDQLSHTRLQDITVIIHIIAATKNHGAKELLIEMIDDIDDLSTVIVGSRGRGAIKGLLLGSISYFLVHNSPVPVMVVRAPKNKGKKKKKGKKGRQIEHTKVVREANRRYEAAMLSDDD